METQFNPGDQIDHYRLDRVVAENNAATIFRATDLRDESRVTIKIPHPELMKDRMFADWFRREVEIGKPLDHPGVIKILPGDPTQTNTYMVMEWFEGKTLRQLLDEENKLSPDRAISIAIAIGKALEYIHGRGILHLDLQPESIMIGAGDQVKLTDFSGAAKMGARRLTFTKLAQITGSSQYISPEELLGKKADARSDLYVLGIILYEMLLGKLPFPPADPSVRLLNHPIPPREIDPAISPKLQEVIYRAMERDPRNRYPSAHDFAWDLDHLDQVGVADRPELRDWKKQGKSNSKKILVYVGVALIPIVIFVLLLYFSRN